MRIHTSSWAALAAIVLFVLMLPTTALGQSSCKVHALDSVAGLGTEISLSNCAVNSAMSMRIRNPAGATSEHTVSTDAFGTGIHNLPGASTIVAGTYTVTVGSASVTFEVLADRPDDSESTLIAGVSSVSTGGETTVTAILRDKYGNEVTGRAMSLVSSRATDDITALSGKTDTDGRILWQVRASQPGLMQLSLFDVVSGRQMKRSTSVQVGTSTLAAHLGMGQSDLGFLAADLSNGIVDRFELSLEDGGQTVQANELFSLQITAYDINNQVVRSYVGSLAVESSDPNAELPKKGEDTRNPSLGRIDMLAVYQGQRTVPLSFLLRAVGTQTLTVYDINNPSIRGELRLRVGGKPGSGDSGIIILDPPDRATVGGHTITIRGRAPSFVNLEFRGGVTTVFGESDAEGTFAATVQLDPTISEATIFVRSENGTYEATAHYFIDTDAPSITSIDIDPSEGRTRDPAVITVRAEPELSVTARVLDTDVLLEASAEDAALYRGSVTAPAEAGTYDVTVKATDTVGNASPATIVKWNVLSKEIPIVQNLEAIGQAQQVALNWDAVDGIEVAEYIVYIARDDDPENLLYSIRTKKPTTSAIVQDLPLGVTYLFSVTAADATGNESIERSAPVRAAPLGTRITVTPGNQSLLLEWSKMDNLPLSHYILEYGTEPENLTERRSVHGVAESYMLRDLFSGVEYFIRMTPIAVTGQTRADLAVTTSGIPTGKGFVAGSNDPVPPGTLDDLHPGAPLLPPTTVTPATPGTGVPTTLMMGILTLSLLLFGLYMRHVRTERRKMHAFLEMMQHRYHG